MKSKELMIGDLIDVFGKNRNISATPHWYYKRVTSDWLVDMERREDTNKILVKQGISIPFPQIGDTAPIPLTEEILKANGWLYCIDEGEYRSSEDIAYKEPLRLQLGEDGNAFWWIVGIVLVTQINFVHELQHALRLCGLNDLADNFKIE